MRQESDYISVLLTVLSLLAPGCGFAAEPPTGIAVLWAYAGTWKTETQDFDTAHSKAGSEKATLRNACWKDGMYLACNQYVDGDSKVLLVFTYNASDKSYTSYQIPQNGGAAGRGTVLIDGNVWTFPWQIIEGETTTYYRVVNTFMSNDRIEFRKEFSSDRVHWTLMAKGSDVRISRNAPR